MRFTALCLFLLPQSLSAVEPSRSLPEGATLRLGAFQIGQPQLESAVLTPDGTKLYTTTRKSDAIRILNVKTGAGLALLPEIGVIGKFALTADGKSIAVATAESIRFLDATTGKPLEKTFPFPKDIARPLSQFCFSADANWLAAQFQNKEIVIWRLPSGEIAHKIAATDPLDGFSADSKWIFSTGITWWNVETGKEKIVARSTTPEIANRRYSPDGKLFIQLGKRGGQLFDAETGERKRTLEGAPLALDTAMFSLDGKYLATTGDRVRVWEVASSKAVHSYPPGELLGFSRNHQLVVRSRNNQMAVHHDVTAPKGHALEIWRIAYSPDGKIIATCSMDHTAQLWDAQTGNALHILKGHDAGIFDIAFSADGKTLYSAAHDGTVREWDVAAGTGKVRFQSMPGRADDIHRSEYFSAVACSADSQWLVAANSNASWLYMTRLKERTPRIQRAAGTVYFLAFSSQGKLAMGGPVRDGISVVDLVEPTWRRDFGKVVAESAFHDIAFSPDGNYLASTGLALKVWDIETGTIHREFAGASAAQRHVAYSPDGKALATDDAHSITLWEVATGKKRGKLGAGYTASGNVNALAFSPDGKFITAGYDDGTALVWDVHYQKSFAELTAKTMESMWKTLAEPEAAEAFQCICRFRASPEKSIAFLDKELQQLIKADVAHIDALIRQLDDDRFAIREKATKELIRIGSLARPAVERASQSTSQEVSMRAKRILEAIDKGVPAVSFPDDLRSSRALEILEAIGDDAAKKLLRSIRDSQLDTPLTKEAKAALGRLEKQRN
jgi:WD40 repeat protein